MHAHAATEVVERSGGHTHIDHEGVFKHVAGVADAVAVRVLFLRNGEEGLGFKDALHSSFIALTMISPLIHAPAVFMQHHGFRASALPSISRSRCQGSHQQQV